LSNFLEINYQASESGQRINKEKSSIYFSKGCSQFRHNVIKAILEVGSEALNERYLGMPTDVGASRYGTFKFLRDRVWSRVKGWLEKILSVGGKEVLIKYVAHAIPVYSLTCFILPRGLCEDIYSLIHQFWWGSKETKRKPC
jgi:hypothetical protein